jgi:serine O-acetyltransferase
MIEVILFRILLIPLYIFYLIKFGNIWSLKNYLQETSERQRSRKSYKMLLSLYLRQLVKSGSWIGYDAQFLGIPYFPHGIYGIFISGGAKIGKNVIIFQHVTIGSNTLNNSDNAGSPVIGDNVYIGAGAKIIGNICIGNNCRIGANAVVYENLPPNSIAVQSPTRIIQKKTPLDNRYYSQKNGQWVFFNNGEWIEDRNKKI